MFSLCLIIFGPTQLLLCPGVRQLTSHSNPESVGPNCPPLNKVALKIADVALWKIKPQKKDSLVRAELKSKQTLQRDSRGQAQIIIIRVVKFT